MKTEGTGSYRHLVLQRIFSVVMVFPFSIIIMGLGALRFGSLLDQSE